MSDNVTLLDLVEEHIGKRGEAEAFGKVEEAARDLLAEYEAVVARFHGPNLPAAQAMAQALLDLDRARARGD